jgi:hypothetical protein
MVDQMSTHTDISHTKQHIETLVETDGYQVPDFGPGLVSNKMQPYVRVELITSLRWNLL